MKRMLKILLEIAAVNLATFFIMSYETLKNFFFSRDIMWVYLIILGIAIGFIFVSLRDRTIKHIEEIIAFTLIALHYYLIAWSPLGFTAFLKNVFPIAGLVAAMYIAVTNFKNDNDNDEE